jgi:hypothetical protein
MIDLLLRVSLILRFKSWVCHLVTLDVDIRALIDDVRAVIVIGLRGVGLQGAMTGQYYDFVFFFKS